MTPEGVELFKVLALGSEAGVCETGVSEAYSVVKLMVKWSRLASGAGPERGGRP